MSTAKPLCIQINWQRQFGGGEVYTRFFTQALQALGWEVHLIVDRQAAFWKALGMDDVRFIPIDHGHEIPALLVDAAKAVVTHNVLPPDLAKLIAARHRLGGLVHMPLLGRDPKGLAEYHRIFPVSEYVRQTVLKCGYTQVHDEPLLGVADLAPRAHRAKGGEVIVRRSEFDWDKRKFRDRFLSWLTPLETLRPRQPFARKPGLTLGIVSRITPIKQFPALFSLLAPVLADFPNVNLEIFGCGGYASIRDLKRALSPIGERVRFWGHQADPATVYTQLDYVLSGLPEREALGLNLIEAQAVGTPVIAVDAPPFTETVMQGDSGFLYTDPRQDQGAGFRDALGKLTTGLARPDPRLATAHLARFSTEAFKGRVANAMGSLAT